MIKMIEKIKMERLSYAPLLLFQLILMVLYLALTRYATGGVGADVKGFEDTHVMIFIGFAFLMTFLKKYCYSALGYNLVLAALSIQWALICQSLFHMKHNVIFISKKQMLEADIMSATVLITFGALLGLASGAQLLFLSIVEVAVGCSNLYLAEDIFKVSDIGGSMCIHAYGAYFGLGASTALRMKKPEPEPASPSGIISLPYSTPKEVVRLDGPNYISDVTAMIGSLFLWIYWPSFNSALAKSPAEFERATINTYLSLASCTVTSFVLSAALSHKPGKFDMVHIQNSPLAGGVGVGAVANLLIGPGVAIAIGIGAGFISVFGYVYLTPMLEKLGIQDTCGVNNLHGLPGIYSGLLSVLFTSLIKLDKYGDELYQMFPAMMIAVRKQAIDDPITPGTLPDVLFPTTTGMKLMPTIKPGRSPGMQAVYQLICLVTSLALGYASGLISGFIAKAKIFSPLEVKKRYDDDVNWVLP